MEKLNMTLLNVAKNGNVKFPVCYTETFLNQSVGNLDLDARSSNVLDRGNIYTIGDIIENVDAIRKVKGCGTRTVNRILYQVCVLYYKQLDGNKKDAYLKEIIKLNA